MNLSETIPAVYLAVINIVTFIAFALDKYRARHDRWRIPEGTLLLLCAIGGAAGGLFAMYGVHHKTRKPKFYITVPLLLLLWICVLICLFR